MREESKFCLHGVVWEWCGSCSLRRERDALKESLEAVRDVLRGVQATEAGGVTGDPYVDGINALKAEVEDLRRVCSEQREAATINSERLREAWARNDSLQTENQRLIAERNELRRLDTLADMRETELEAALRKHGRHLWRCAALIEPTDSEGNIIREALKPCTCGLDTALTGAPSGRTK